VSVDQIVGSQDPAEQFLNRTSQVGQVQRHLLASRRDPRHFACLEVSGVAGAGKSRLLLECHRRASEMGHPHLARVSLMAEASATVVGPLRVLRRELGIDCFLFDAALVRYLNAMGQFHGEIDNEGVRFFLSKSAEIAGSFAPVPLPVNFAVSAFRKMSYEVKRRLRYEEEEFEAIDALSVDPPRLRKHLPQYLGRDIALHLDTTEESLAIFYDSYEKQSAETLLDKSPWLRKLIETVDRGVHVISTREPLAWPSNWSQPVEPVSVDALPEVESRALLQSFLGALEPEVEARLLKASRQIPLMLQAAIQAYAGKAGDGDVITFDDLPDASESMLDFLFEHLTSTRRRVAVAIAAVQVFDAGLYDHLIRSLHLPISDLDFPEVASSLFVEDIGPGLYKTHDLFTDVVRESAADRDLREAGLVAATRYLLSRCAGDGAEVSEVTLPLLRAVLDGWCSLDAVAQKSVEGLVDAGYLLYDAGYWHELASLVPTPEVDAEHGVAVVVEFFRALAARRGAGVGHSQALFAALRPRLGLLGRHKQSAEVEIAYLNELAGNYREARKEFEELSRRAVPFDASDRSQLRARLYHGDMLIMDGRFLEGSRLLVETYEKVGVGAPLDWAELVRYRGQALRYSFLFDEAALLYEQAARVAADAPAMLAKLQTNLAEVHCLSDPGQALEIATLSAHENRRLNNRIELAKCDAIKAIAHAKLQEPRCAAQAAARAARLAEDVGYPAGLAFAVQAEAIAHGLAGSQPRLLGSLERLDSLVKELGTYGHLRAAPAWLTGDDALFLDAALDVEWIEPDDLEDRLSRCLGR
jgi:hypothetical protein